MRPDVRLTAGQMRMIEHAARALAPPERDMFKFSVVSRLAGEPSSAAVNAAINGAMDLRALFMTDAAPTPENPKP